MAAKTFFVVCAQALLIQCALSQCIGRGPALGLGLAGPSGLAYDGLAGCGYGGIASTGGGFPVTSISPIAPTGLSIVSENAIEGTLTLGGEVPFLSAVALEGLVPTIGVGAISYGCGSGPIGIISENPIVGPAYGPALAAAPVYGPGLAYGNGLGAAGLGLAPGLGFNGLAGIGCGCGL